MVSSPLEKEEEHLVSSPLEKEEEHLVSLLLETLQVGVNATNHNNKGVQVSL